MWYDLNFFNIGRICIMLSGRNGSSDFPKGGEPLLSVVHHRQTFLIRLHDFAQNHYDKKHDKYYDLILKNCYIINFKSILEEETPRQNDPY
jgi:hypothetical protein